MFYAAAARLAGAASAVMPAGGTKATLAIRARRGIRDRYTAWGSANRVAGQPLLWMHAPSVGEGLQARPVIALVRERHPDVQVAYTFFSPSAEEFSRTLDVQFRDYLPFDTAPDMRVALKSLRPTALVFSKLDVWPELVRQAKRDGVRVGLVSATLAEGSRRRGRAARLILGDAYAALDAVGAVDDMDAARLEELGVPRHVIRITGDTRFDQVWQRAEGVDRREGLLARLASDRPTLVAGSTWPADERPLLEGITRARRRVAGLRIILAPHEPTPEHLAPLEQWAAASGLALSRIDDPAAADADVALVDRFGVLGDLYALAGVAFVGGGFHDAGLHSVLEPAAFGAPVLFGPRHHKSRDATLLLRADAARSVSSAADIERALIEWFEQPEIRDAAGRRARAVVERGKGAAERSLQLVEQLLF